jgi:hypothetical protein
MRLETLPIQGSPPGETEIIRRIEQRVAEFEQRQGIAIAVLRGEIARFIDDSAQRFEALAQAHQGGDLAAEFESLRRRVEDRIVDVEQRSVRALEQVADTMTVLEKRFSGDPETALRTA